MRTFDDPATGIDVVTALPGARILLLVENGFV